MDDTILFYVPAQSEPLPVDLKGGGTVWRPPAQLATAIARWSCNQYQYHT